MGSKMVAHLKSEGYTSISVFDNNKSAAKKISKDLGSDVVVASKSVKNIGATCDIVLAMVPNDAAITEVSEQLLSAKRKAGSPRLVVISCSTISPLTSRRIASEFEAKGASFIAAPVFARPDGLAKKQATWMVAGETHGREVATQLLSHMGVVHDFGHDVGAANVVKLCGNFLIASSIEAIAESMALAEKSGVDRGAVMSLLSSTIFDCLIYKGYGQRVSQRDHRPGGFSLVLGAKDVGLVSQAAKETEVPMPFLSTLVDRFTSAKARGRGEFDWSAIGLSVAEDAGVDVSADVERNVKDIKDGRTY